jgi:hypothetical protein
MQDDRTSETSLARRRYNRVRTEPPYDLTQADIDYVLPLIDAVWAAGFETYAPIYNIYQSKDGTIDYHFARRDKYGGRRRLF